MVLIVAYFPLGIPVKLWVNLQDIGLDAVYPLLWTFFAIALLLAEFKPRLTGAVVSGAITLGHRVRSEGLQHRVMAGGRWHSDRRRDAVCRRRAEHDRFASACAFAVSG